MSITTTEELVKLILDKGSELHEIFSDRQIESGKEISRAMGRRDMFWALTRDEDALKRDEISIIKLIDEYIKETIKCRDALRNHVDEWKESKNK